MLWAGLAAHVWADVSPAPAPASQPATGPAGTAIHSPSQHRIRVRLLHDVPRARLVMPGGFALLDSDSGRSLAESGPCDSVSVVFGLASIGFPDLQRAFECEAVDLVPRGEGQVGLELEGKTLYFRGHWRLMRRPNGLGTVLNVVDIEDYLPAVVAGELDRRFHLETFRAQAIACRTFAWYQKQTVGRKRDWDVTAGESSQVYRSLERVRQVPQAARAVQDTRGIVCTWLSPMGYRIFCTYYSSACGGTTQSAAAIHRNGAVPPLAGDVPCPSCRQDVRFAWGPVRVGKASLTELLRERYERFEDIGPIVRVAIVEATPFGRAVRFAFEDAEGGRIELEAENLRLSLDPTGRQIRSTLFDLLDEGEEIVLSNGHGFGHGVGMCQHGAEALARQGKTAGQILRHYYPGCVLRRAY